jgi:hypothetical protein
VDGSRLSSSRSQISETVGYDGDETLAVMRTLDLVRERVGLRYPGEA